MFLVLKYVMGCGSVHVICGSNNSLQAECAEAFTHSVADSGHRFLVLDCRWLIQEMWCDADFFATHIPSGSPLPSQYA